MAESLLSSEVANVAGTLGSVDRDGERTSNENTVNGTRPEARLNVDAVNAERLVKLKRSRSGHQGYLTVLYKKISILLSDTKHAREVKELRDIINREWDRFTFIHDEILACVAEDTLAIENARLLFGEQAQKRTALLNTVSQYLESCEVEDPQPIDKSFKGDYETRSEISINESIKSLRSNRSSIKTNVSTRSLDARLKRQKAELALDQLRKRQNLEREVEQHKLELQQIVELRKLEDNIELAKLEEQFATEYEQNMFDDNELTKIHTPLEYEYSSASPRKATPETKEKHPVSYQHLSRDKPLKTHLSVPVSSPSDPIRQLAETFASLSHTPPMEVTKFAGDPREYWRLITRFKDQVLSQPVSESKKLSRLMQYLDGKAKEAVEEYEGMGDGALQEALSVIETRFGQPYMIVEASIGSLVKGPNITSGDGKALQKLADKCQSVYKTLEAMKCLGEVNTDHQKRLVCRLPYHYQTKWRDRASSIMKATSKLPSFYDLVQFLQERASAENNPVFGNLKELSKAETNRKKRYLDSTINSPRISSFATQFTPNQSNRVALVCPSCQQSHHLHACPKFLNMTVIERRKIVRESRRCFQCLSFGHYKRNCRGAKCDFQGCDRRHHRLLHLSDLDPKKNQNNVENPEQRKVTMCDANVQTNAANVVPDVYKGATALPVVAVLVHGQNGQSKSTYALLDQASEASFIHKELAKDLDLKGSESTLSIKSLTGSTSINAEKVTVTVEAADRAPETSKLLARDVIVTDNFDVHLKVVPRKDNLLGWKHLSDVNFPNVDRKGIQMLIGADNPAAFVTEQVRIGGPGEPWAFKYKLGWALIGPTNCGSSNHVDVHFLQRSSVDFEESCLKELVTRYFKRDGLGVVSDTQKMMSIEDRRALKMMEESTTMVDNHYEVGMLWNRVDPQLPDNRSIALKRLEHLKNRLKKDKVLHQKYREKIEEYVNKGYARKLRPDEVSNTSATTWSLPHHPVFHPAKPGKTRIVFDAAAKFENTSLNDNLLQGPNLANEIVDVLIRFRKERVAVVADIQEMFHQVKVPEKDRNSLRFLWFSSDLDSTPETYCMNVHIFGAKDSPSIANFALQKTAKDNSSNFSQSAIETVGKNFYVDDLLKSMLDEQEAIPLCSEIIQLLRRGGFRLYEYQ